MIDAQVEPADVRAEDLALRLNGPLPEVLAQRWQRWGKYRLHLAVLGASHIVSAYTREGLYVREEISTTAPQGMRPLPDAWKRKGYRLDVRIDRGADFEHEAYALGIAPEWFVVRFPGVGPHHLTALRAGVTGEALWWETRHCYPGQKAIVRTRSEVRA
ncbi:MULTISPECIES: DUF2617 family protein [unclassified Corynebacterium]|uniref:DUF2617 family protein n=1 Tax=unclassified Corynebacterium TaxID=2624378 RepID=UPI0029C9C5E5|nr:MULTISPECIES: DUF2617 family protein [unclassified Corynebacterium]WPF65376.1 DUF2617 family protein [Corynebacterium sp. 22KM0430]WPF67871.1 DUF2617 family protein [Corynebacterium sp. 21KM1197]